MPPTDSADFVRTTVDLEDNRQRLYVGYAGNGVFLGPAGDGAPEQRRRPGRSLPIAFGDFWDEQARVALLGLSLTPGPSSGDPYWQVLDIDTGRATTCWQFGSFPARRGLCCVETVVTPEGVICWQVRSTGRPMRLSAKAPLIGLDAWEVKDGVATARLQSAIGAVMVSLQVSPRPEWRFAEVGRGEERRELLQADLGREAFIALVQRALPEGSADAQGVGALSPYASFEEASRSSLDAWSQFWARSTVNIPDQEIMKWYRRSLYYLAAMSAHSHFPPGPMGPHPGRWGGRIFGHDATYMHAALLTSNHPAISGQFVEWYLDTLDRARRVARQGHDLPGARYGWEQNWRGDECAPEPFRHEHHVNADIAWQAWRQAEWTGDTELAARIGPLLRDTASFLAAHLQWEEGVQAFVSPRSSDLDENAPDVAGAIATQASAAWLAEVCHDSGVSTEAIERMRGRVHLPQSSTPDGPVLTAYIGDSAERAMKHPSPILPIWWLGVTDPDGDLARRTFHSALRRVDLDRTPTFNRAWLAAAAARMHDGDRAGALLSDLVESPSVVDDTCFVETQGSSWSHFLTTCGALVAAVNEMLLQCPERGVIEVFPAVPAEWGKQGVSFETLLARGGILVSGQLSQDEVVVTIDSPHPTHDVVLDLPDIIGQGGATVAEVDGGRADIRTAPRHRIRVKLPASPKAAQRVRVRTQAD